MKILWEDRDLLAVVKPAGLEVDSGGRHDDVVKQTGAFAFHRLDKDTSGIVLLGLSKRYAREVTLFFEEKRIRKAYQAVVRGDWSHSRADLPIDGETALTTFRRLARGSFNDSPVSLIEALPKTGRTHQIRIHCAQKNHPILGDLRYGDEASKGERAHAALNDDQQPMGHALHAWRLDFRHPGTGETISLRAEPDWSRSWLKEFSR